MSKTVRAKTKDKAVSFTDNSVKVMDFNQDGQRLAYKKIVRFAAFTLPGGSMITGLLGKFLPRKKNIDYFDINHLARLAQEESYTMPRGLTREQRREWAKKNLEK